MVDEPQEAIQNKLSPSVLITFPTAETTCSTKQVKEWRVYSGSLFEGTVHLSGERQFEGSVHHAGE